jgi:hypothetical protein
VLWVSPLGHTELLLRLSILSLRINYEETPTVGNALWDIREKFGTGGFLLFMKEGLKLNAWD